MEEEKTESVKDSEETLLESPSHDIEAIQPEGEIGSIYEENESSEDSAKVEELVTEDKPSKETANSVE